MQEFTMNHSEADTMLLSIYHQLRVGDYFGTVVIDTEDTDVYAQSAYVSGFYGHGKKVEESDE